MRENFVPNPPYLPFSTLLITANSYFRAGNPRENSDFDSRAKAPPAKRSEKGYGTRMD